MSTTQEKRERFNKGDTVHVLVSPAPNLPTKRRPAKVIEVMRAACKVQVEGENKPRTIRFSALQPAPPAPPAPKPKPAPLRAVQSAEPSPLSRPAQPQVPASDLDSWLAMGAELVAPMRAELAQLADEDEALEEEAKAIASERAAIQLQAKRLRTAIARVEDALGEDGAA